MLEMKEIRKGYGKKVLYSDFNLTIEPGEFVVLGGKSGCGKTTLLNMIGSLEKPDAGTITYNGKDIFSRGYQRKYLQSDVSFLFQNFALVENKTVRQNLALVQKKQQSDYTMESALEFVGLSDVLNQKVYQLSGGEQQRVAMARVLMKKSSLVLADEPTGSLDKENADNIIRLLKELNKQGKTIIMVTHMEEYRNVGSRFLNIEADAGKSTSVFCQILTEEKSNFVLTSTEFVYNI